MHRIKERFLYFSVSQPSAHLDQEGAVLFQSTHSDQSRKWAQCSFMGEGALLPILTI